MSEHAFARPTEYQGYIVEGHDGLTKREWFAGQALAGLCANSAFITDARDVCKGNKESFLVGIATSATQLADATLAELAKEKTT